MNVWNEVSKERSSSQVFTLFQKYELWNISLQAAMAMTGDRSLFAFDSGVSVGTVLQGGDFLQAVSGWCKGKYNRSAQASHLYA